MGLGRIQQVQHRPKESKAEVSLLRKENRNLRQQLARMQRSLRRAIDERQEVADIAQDFAEPMAGEDVVQEGARCPKCGDRKLNELAIPSGILVVCTGCKHRWVDRTQKQGAE